MKRSTLLIIFLLNLFLVPSWVFSQSKPYLILVSFDAFRWDYPGRGLTPTLDYIKANGVSALSLRPSFPSKTFPNHLSIITGMYPEHHGIIHNDFENPFSGEKYATSDTSAVRNGKWYLGEAFWETAERQGIRTASYFWPGSELSLPYRRPSYFETYEHKRPYSDRIEGVINWLKLPYKERPHFITLYMSETDDQGHRFGPDAPQTNRAIKQLDSLAGVLLKRIKDISMADSVNVIFLSDHGMTGISTDRMINIEEIAGPGNIIQGNGPVMMVEPENGSIQKTYEKLKSAKAHFMVYTRKDMPEYFHFDDNPFIYSIIIVADPGWSLVDNKSKSAMLKYNSKGNHGYDNNYMDMHGIFYAIGPAFRNGYSTGTLWNIDIYPLLCRIFDIFPRQNIDGRLERIGFILK